VGAVLREGAGSREGVGLLDVGLQHPVELAPAFGDLLQIMVSSLKTLTDRARRPIPLTQVPANPLARRSCMKRAIYRGRLCAVGTAVEPPRTVWSRGGQWLDADSAGLARWIRALRRGLLLSPRSQAAG
jgi:hypothetical protein